MFRRQILRLAVLGAAAALTAPALAAADPPASPAPTAASAPLAPLTAPRPDDETLGSPKARVTVVEYASASCPHCARFNNEIFPAFKAKYVDTGRVFYVFREFLTPPTSLAGAAFLLARCAGKGRYFAVVDAVFAQQADIYTTGDVKGHLLKIAAQAGLDEKAVDACLSDRKAIDALNARMTRAMGPDQIRSTPTFIVGDQKLEGEQSLASLDAAILAAEAKAPPPPRRTR